MIEWQLANNRKYLLSYKEPINLEIYIFEK